MWFSIVFNGKNFPSYIVPPFDIIFEDDWVFQAFEPARNGLDVFKFRGVDVGALYAQLNPLEQDFFERNYPEQQRILGRTVDASFFATFKNAAPTTSSSSSASSSPRSSPKPQNPNTRQPSAASTSATALPDHAGGGGDVYIKVEQGSSFPPASSSCPIQPTTIIKTEPAVKV